MSGHQKGWDGNIGNTCSGHDGEEYAANTRGALTLAVGLFPSCLPNF